jgi:hypothetical protein
MSFYCKRQREGVAGQNSICSDCCSSRPCREVRERQWDHFTQAAELIEEGVAGVAARRASAPVLPK